MEAQLKTAKDKFGEIPGTLKERIEIGRAHV